MNQMSENINELMSALAKAQGKIRYAKKEKINPFHKSKYADLASVWDACRSALSENGLAVVQTIDTVEGEMILRTILGHASGQWMSSTMPIVLTDTKPQTIGSLLTYYRRYSLSAMVGISPDDGEDDDANSAQDIYKEAEKKPEAKPINNQKNKVEPLKPQPEPPKPSGPKLNREQIKELQMYLNDLSKKFKDKFWQDVKPRGWITLDDIPENSFISLKNHFLEKIAEEKFSQLEMVEEAN